MGEIDLSYCQQSKHRKNSNLLQIYQIKEEFNSIYIKYYKMALANSPSCVVSFALSVLLFSGMQMAKPFLIASQPATILGGFLGSILFVFLLTGLGNLEKMAFGYGLQTKFPEALFCLIIAVMASGSVHRVSASTCVLFSAAMLYSMNSISNQVHGGEKTVVETGKNEKSKKRK